MKLRWRKIILAVFLIIVALPVLFVLAALASFSIMDRTNGSIVSSGMTRRYLLHVPKNIDRSKETPLVISIHPAATWPAVQESISRWNDLADEHGFIVVYPAGSGAFFGGFGAGPHVWPGGRDLERDVKFISDLINKLQAAYNIDPRRIYANGMSNGGAMAVALSCVLPDRIAAVGAVAAALPPTPGRDECGHSEPIPTVLFHGTADKMAPYQGGKSPIAPGPFPNIQDWTALVAQRNQCKDTPIETRISPMIRRRAYTNCANNADVILYTIEHGGHTWPGGEHLAEWIAGRTSDDINATDVMWQFFVLHPLAAK
ncbi:MAG TPA: PHB depolymerase family esterase [Terriglobales bacterium]|nr:PHB depolymerase family esterase [Terriglobales bacterium]